MENSTSIQNLKDDTKNNSEEIDNIINQIQQDSSKLKEQMPPQQMPPQEMPAQEEITYEEPSTYDVIYNEVSYPLLVIVLFIILSIPQLDSLLCSYISFICSESGDINFFGILLKSLLMGILFYIFGKYVV